MVRLAVHRGGGAPVDEQHARGGIESAGTEALGGTCGHQACNGQHLDYVFHVHSLSWFYVIAKALWARINASMQEIIQNTMLFFC